MAQDTEIYVATTSFIGGGLQVTVGDTVAGGHPLLKGREQFFVPFSPTFDHARENAAAKARNDAKRQARAESRKAEGVARETAANVALEAAASAETPGDINE